MAEQSENYVALLGTKGGPAIRPGSTMPTSSLLKLSHQTAVVDCGLGVTRGLIDQGMQLKDIELIFITHLHSDHYLELGPLLHTAWTAGLQTPVTIYGPDGLVNYWLAFLQSMKADIDLRIDNEGRPDLAGLVTIKTIEAGEVFSCDAFNVTAMRNIHPPLIDTFALSFKSNMHHVVFSGDTAYLPELAGFAKNADLLIHEAMLQEALGPLMKRIGNADDRLMQHWLRSHTYAHDVAKIASSAKVGALALHHLLPSDDPDFTEQHWRTSVEEHWSGTLHVGKDGLRIDLQS